MTRSSWRGSRRGRPQRATPPSPALPQPGLRSQSQVSAAAITPPPRCHPAIGSINFVKVIKFGDK